LLDEGRLAGAAVVSAAGVWAVAPGAIRLARRSGFLDHPTGYKNHNAPTAYLGGAAVLAGFLVGGLLFGSAFTRFAPIVVCAIALAVVGTIDDRVTVRPLYRVLAEVAAAAAITAFGLGWTFLSNPFEEFLLNAVWIVAFVNAFNLFDNMNGAAGATGATCGSGIAALAIVQGDMRLAAFALAITGACIGFLRFNLTSQDRARIFLGDGGSMPLGFLLAVAAANIPVADSLGWPKLLLAGMLLGILVLDTLLVIVSRSRRGVALATGGQDHLTHRLCAKVGTPLQVAALLVIAQGTLSALTVLVSQSGRTAIITAGLASLSIGAAVIALLDSPAWASEISREPRPKPVEPSGEPAPRLRARGIGVEPGQVDVNALQVRGDVQQLGSERAGQRGRNHAGVPKL
jgi:UDP-GlcNAc:undecaprenyl-phosphate GlcNAc-1-phosphate transferase